MIKSYLERNTPAGVEARAGVYYSVRVSAHKVHYFSGAKQNKQLNIVG